MYCKKVVDIKGGIYGKSKRIFDNSKVSDHHAIILTEQKTNLFNLSNDLLAIDQSIKEIIEDMCVIAINDAMNKIDKETESMLGAYGGQLNGLF